MSIAHDSDALPPTNSWHSTGLHLSSKTSKASPLDDEDIEDLREEEKTITDETEA